MSWLLTSLSPGACSYSILPALWKFWWVNSKHFEEEEQIILLTPEGSGCECDTWSFPLKPLTEGTAEPHGTGCLPKWFPREVQLPLNTGGLVLVALKLGFSLLLPWNPDDWFLPLTKALNLAICEGGWSYSCPLVSNSSSYEGKTRQGEVSII